MTCSLITTFTWTDRRTCRHTDIRTDRQTAMAKQTQKVILSRSVYIKVGLEPIFPHRKGIPTSFPTSYIMNSRQRTITDCESFCPNCLTKYSLPKLLSQFLKGQPSHHLKFIKVSSILLSISNIIYKIWLTYCYKQCGICVTGTLPIFLRYW